MRVTIEAILEKSGSYSPSRNEGRWLLDRSISLTCCVDAINGMRCGSIIDVIYVDECGQRPNSIWWNDNGTWLPVEYFEFSE